MSKTLLHPKIQKLKARSAPVNYDYVGLDKSNFLKTRASNLKQRVVEGYGCIWNNRNLHGEKFVKGAFARSIREHGPGSGSPWEIKFFDQHYRALARFEEIVEDEIGLYFRTKPLDKVQQADELLVQIESGTINNYSNAFNYVYDRIEFDETDDSLVIFEARLFHISAVDTPSDMKTFTIRSAEAQNELVNLADETENFIRSLPRKNQIEARHYFARYKTLINADQPNVKEVVQNRNSSPSESGAIDYEYLIKNL